MAIASTFSNNELTVINIPSSYSIGKILFITKEKPIQMKNFITQEVNAPIHPARKIPKIRVFKGFPKFHKKKKK